MALGGGLPALFGDVVGDVVGGVGWSVVGEASAASNVASAPAPDVEGASSDGTTLFDFSEWLTEAPPPLGASDAVERFWSRRVCAVLHSAVSAANALMRSVDDAMTTTEEEIGALLQAFGDGVVLRSQGVGGGGTAASDATPPADAHTARLVLIEISNFLAALEKAEKDNKRQESQSAALRKLRSEPRPRKPTALLSTPAALQPSVPASLGCQACGPSPVGPPMVTDASGTSPAVGTLARTPLAFSSLAVRSPSSTLALDVRLGSTSLSSLTAVGAGIDGSCVDPQTLLAALAFDDAPAAPHGPSSASPFTTFERLMPPTVMRAGSAPVGGYGAAAPCDGGEPDVLPPALRTPAPPPFSPVPEVSSASAASSATCTSSSSCASVTFGVASATPPTSMRGHVGDQRCSTERLPSVRRICSAADAVPQSDCLGGLPSSPKFAIASPSSPLESCRASRGSPLASLLSRPRGPQQRRAASKPWWPFDSKKSSAPDAGVVADADVDALPPQRLPCADGSTPVVSPVVSGEARRGSGNSTGKYDDDDDYF